LQDERFASLDEKLQKFSKELLHQLVKIHDVTTAQNNAHNAGSKPGDMRPSNERHSSKSVDLEQNICFDILHGLLRFSTMTYRRQEIDEAHKKTFAWIFCDQLQAAQIDLSQNHIPKDNFVKWLREDGGIYWIKGKAGSGKSTLMRFIVESQQTQHHLQHWARNSRLHVSSFYFRNSGAVLQRSRKGFLRSLFFDVLTKHPDLIRPIFDDEWEEIKGNYACQTHTLGSGIDEIPMKRLDQCFAKLISCATSEFRLCFFIDGLDESEEAPEELLELIEISMSSPFVKICLSSRPWIVFDNAFDQCPSLQLQDLTYKDIEHYVHDKLRSKQMMKDLEEIDPIGATSLVSNIVAKADGVFLCVRIVTKSLLNGLSNMDDIAVLQRKLDVLPRDLDALYTHMFDIIDTSYIDNASQIFQIFDAAIDVNLRPGILELELAVTANYPTFMSTLSLARPARQRMPDLEIEQRCTRMTTYLKSRCGGLLEVKRYPGK
jgi:hypothetical protein